MMSVWDGDILDKLLSLDVGHAVNTGNTITVQPWLVKLFLLLSFRIELPWWMDWLVDCVDPASCGIS